MRKSLFKLWVLIIFEISKLKLLMAADEQSRKICIRMLGQMVVLTSKSNLNWKAMKRLYSLLE